MAKALITGGSAGIGRALALLMAARGTQVVIVGRDRARLDAVAAARPDRIVPLAADLADPAQVDRLIATVARDHADTGLLVNNAALQSPMTLTRAPAPLAELRSEIAVNLAAPMALAAGLLPILAANPQPAVVNLTSALAVAPKAAAPVYCATKAGLRNFSRGLRHQCAADLPAVAVIDVVMALVDTGMTAGRGGGKISADRAAAAVLAAIDRRAPEAWIGKTRIIRLLDRLYPPLAAAILR